MERPERLRLSLEELTSDPLVLHTTNELDRYVATFRLLVNSLPDLSVAADPARPLDEDIAIHVVL
jgi:hypothetical protein